VTHREARELPVYNLVLARSDGRFGPAFKESSKACLAALRESIEAARRGAPVTATTKESGSLKGCVGVTLGGLGMVSMNGTTIGTLANSLTQSVDRPVIDRTGLTSFYNLTLKWTPETGAGLRPFGLPRGVLPGDAPGALPPPPADPDAPDIFTAVQEQLGLKLEAGRGPVEVVVIDRLEKPTLD